MPRQNSPVDNRRIAKNAIFLYLRMFISMAVSLFTSRVVLHTLGVMDYGIWNVVGGVIGMFTFLNASMSGCTNRFLSFELGRGDMAHLQKVFSSSLTVHIIIASIILLLGETVGLWFLNEKLVIPPDRMLAANIVYQTTVIGCMVSVTQVPYNAMIMANEKMNVYAYAEVVNVCLRLAIVYALVLSPIDKLVTYGLLSLLVTFGFSVFYRVYCTTRFQSCKFRLTLERQVVMPMLSFSMWDLYGSASVMARTQGVNMLLNMFFTVSMNAASAVATSVQNAVMSFAGNLLAAFRPQIVKTYACGDFSDTVKLIRRASVYTTFLLLVLTLPLLLEIDYVLGLWLKAPPPYAATLCVCVLLFNLVANLSNVVVSAVHATGHIKRSSLINGSLYLLVVPFSYFGFKRGMAAEWAYIFNVVAVCGGLTQNAFVVAKFVPGFSVVRYFLHTLFPMLACSLAAYVAALAVSSSMESSFVRLCATFASSGVLLSALFYLFLFDRGEQKFIREKIKTTYNKSMNVRILHRRMK